VMNSHNHIPSPSPSPSGSDKTAKVAGGGPVVDWLARWGSSDSCQGPLAADDDEPLDDHRNHVDVEVEWGLKRPSDARGGPEGMSALPSRHLPTIGAPRPARSESDGSMDWGGHRGRRRSVGPRTSEERFLGQKRNQLLILVTIEALSALITVVWDVVLLTQMRYEKESHCEHFLNHIPPLEVFVYIVTRLFGLLVPHWAVLYVFYWVDRQLHEPFSRAWDVNLLGVEMRPTAEGQGGVTLVTTRPQPPLQELAREAYDRSSSSPTAALPEPHYVRITD